VGGKIKKGGKKSFSRGKEKASRKKKPPQKGNSPKRDAAWENIEGELLSQENRRKKGGTLPSLEQANGIKTLRSART